MKKIVNQVKITYPFSGTEQAFKCKCDTLLRKSNLHNRTYQVSEFNHDEIIKIKQHVCVKSNEKESRKKAK
jgi:hypothetical protein